MELFFYVDHLWFAFFHEIAHILKHKKQLFLEEKKEFSNDKILEEEDNKVGAAVYQQFQFKL
jgi:Zn-dependent peptidase ImmA (M78 family)